MTRFNLRSIHFATGAAAALLATGLVACATPTPTPMPTATAEPTFTPPPTETPTELPPTPTETESATATAEATATSVPPTSAPTAKPNPAAAKPPRAPAPAPVAYDVKWWADQAHLSADEGCTQINWEVTGAKEVYLRWPNQGENKVEAKGRQEGVCIDEGERAVFTLRVVKKDGSSDVREMVLQRDD